MFKRIFSVIVAVLLISLYILTLIFGLMQNPATTKLLMASIGATMIIPITLFVYQRLYKLVSGTDEEDAKKK